MEDQKYRTEVIIHVADSLDAMRRSALTDDLQKRNGILSSAFCPIGKHLILVGYNNRGIKSQDVLGYVRKQHITASLVGPV